MRCHLKSEERRKDENYFYTRYFSIKKKKHNKKVTEVSKRNKQRKSALNMLFPGCKPIDLGGRIKSRDAEKKRC